MIKKISISLCATVALLVLISAINKPSSAGAPSASTGAPDEQSCGMTTCHDDNSINTGSAKFSIEVGKFGDNQYEGLPIKIRISDIGKMRFGFQITALDENNKKTGQFIITDSIRTQIIGGKVSLPDRDYLTYTYNGTLNSAKDEAEWTANWIPTGINNTGKVTFYAAAISANNDGEDKGDFVYTTKVNTAWENTLNQPKIGTESAIKFIISNKKLELHNPHFTFIKTLSIFDFNGKLILSKTLKNSELMTEIIIPELNSGIIIAKLETSNGIITKKLFITND